MFAPLIALLAVGGLLIYATSSNTHSVPWKTKTVAPGIYFLQVRAKPPVEATNQSIRDAISNPAYDILAVEYNSHTGNLQLLINYRASATLSRHTKVTVAGRPITLTLQTVEKQGDSSRQYPGMSIPLLPGASRYMPPVKAPDNIRHLYANALASMNPQTMNTAAYNLRILGWPELATPLENRANQL